MDTDELLTHILKILPSISSKPFDLEEFRLRFSEILAAIPDKKQQLEQDILALEQHKEEITTPEYIKKVNELEKLLSNKTSELKSLAPHYRKLTPEMKNVLKQELNQKRIAEKSQQRAKNQLQLREEYSAREAEREELSKTRTKITFIGDGYSAHLNQRETKIAKIEELGLPKLENELKLAEFLELSLNDLRWLSFHRKVQRMNHYKTFYIEKSSGGQRRIDAPKSLMKKTQRLILEKLLMHVPLNDSVHGFTKARSIKTNASVHQGHKIIINVDLADFFPSINFYRVRGMFEQFGYSGVVASLLASICTASQVEKIATNGKVFYASEAIKSLPQGAPTSPYISNIIAYSLDKRLLGLARRYNLEYTRYADDISFSGDHLDNLGQFLGKVRYIIQDEDFQLNPKKLRVLRPNTRQEVTGLVTNDKIQPYRKWRRQLRAELHYLKMVVNGKKPITDLPDIASLKGKIAYFKMFDEERSKQMLEEFKDLLEQLPNEAKVGE